ncbi:MAG TPA: WD40 repeat domain-containing protein, partial [Candidatus Hydrogenedentes bacterium]|nr:WD40 repeat domain-containing protein [Candidatus Hydrogenedentota bacterium]
MSSSRISLVLLCALAVSVTLPCPAADACPQFQDGVYYCTPQWPALTEISGLLDSRQNPGVFWVHNDSGDAPRLYALSHTGEHLGVY